MTQKAIIDVELNDSAWKSFNRSVIKHQVMLKQMPGQWGAVGSSINKAGSAASKFVAGIVETNRQFKNANTAAGKLTLALKASDRVVSSLARGTATIGRNLKDATKSLLSWLPIMGIFSGLLGAGGLFGIARLASTVSSGQASSTQAGTTYGGEKAAQISYGQMLGGEGGVTSLLRTMAKEQQTGGLMFRKLSQFGLKETDWKDKDTADILPKFLAALQQMQKKTPEGVKALAAEKFLPAGIDYNTLLGLTSQNLSLLEREMLVRRKALELSRPTQDSWSNFQRQLQFAGEKIENVFIRGLTPLLPALTRFSDGLIKAIGTIMSNPATKNFIEGMGKSLDTFAKYLTSDKFSKDFDSFIDKIHKVGEAVENLAHFINKWLGKSDSEEAFDKDVKRMKERASMPSNAPAGWNGAALVNQIPGNKSASIAPMKSNVVVDVFLHGNPGADVFMSARAAQ